ncbi:hypothetical protein ABZ734_01660 [Streptomyces sp. NPDC006660]|uniref:hypothetical protein n=1 Tax=Streptomyces sp. NPDC006660 TaxID=3156901 RepID=UPI0033D32C62
MVEVDAFWAYAIGAGCALSTAEQLRGAEDSDRRRTVRERDLTATLLFIGLLFTPMGMWLAVRFPGWETMYAVPHIPPWGTALFSAGITASATLGYLCAHRLLAAGRIWAASLQYVGGYTAVFFVLLHGWDGTGMHRFLAPAPREEFSRAQLPSWAELATWLRSPIAVTLLVMGLVLMPAMFCLNARAHVRDDGSRRPVAAPARWSPGVRLVAHAALITLGPCLALALTARLAVSELGALPGGTLWAAAAGAFLRPRGALAAHCRKVVLPTLHDHTETSPPPPLPGPAHEPGTTDSVAHR